jgi:molybdopterin-guanine dinucleotide biosynthesis protein A
MDATTLAVLAGGYGTRMGVPKGQLRVRGVSILEYLMHEWDWPSPTLLVTAPGREHPAGCELFGGEAVDAIADQGPLRGILTALEHAKTPTVVVTAVDMPDVHAMHFAWLIEQFSARPELLGLMLSRDGRVEPFPSIFRLAAAQTIRPRLSAKAQSVHGLSELLGFALVPAPAEWGDSVWTNLNRPADLEAFLARDEFNERPARG